MKTKSQIHRSNSFYQLCRFRLDRAAAVGRCLRRSPSGKEPELIRYEVIEKIK